MKEETLDKIQQYNELLLQVELQINFQHQNLIHIKELQQNIQKLANYMENDWLEDFEKHKNEKLSILSEDKLYNTIMDYRSLQISILKEIVANL